MSSTGNRNFPLVVFFFQKCCIPYLFVLTALSLTANSKIIEKCDVAIELDKSDMNLELADQWICVAEELSSFNTSTMKRTISFQGSSSNESDPCEQYTLGLFQISNGWCNSPDDKEFGSCTRNGCELDCFKLLDDDITDDIDCIKSIHNIHGFRLWPPTTAEACRRSIKLRSSTEWNITECLQNNAKKRRTLSTIPLWAALLIVALSSMAVFTLTYFFYRYRRNSVTILSPSEMKEFRYGRVSSIRPPLSSPRLSEFVRDSFVDQPYNFDFEVAPTEFVIDYTNCLGSGAYGIVYKAVCKGRTVAVKTVKQNATRAYLQSLLGEIKILCHIGRHDFIVNLEAAYTKSLQKGTLYVFMEYCALGSLEKYLRSNRNNYLSLEEIQDDNRVALKSYIEGSSELSVVKNLTFKHLLQYAHQVAKGMEFLASKQVIHGDLAARNILLTSRNYAKISDFGLSRKLYGYIQYIKTKEEPLPWRYMAPESLRENNFSTASDVWMYGVLLFEIFSLGEIPFAGLSWTLDFVDKLENGFRLLKPKHAPDDVYKNKMLKCWEANPVQRPSFFELSNYFHQVLHVITAKEYTELVVADAAIFQTEEEDDDDE